MISSRAIDIAVVVLYLVGITAYGVWAGRKADRSTESYFLAGRRLGWVAIGFSLFATNISLDGFIGGNGMAYRIGIASFVPELTGGLMLTISALFFIPIFLRSKIFTIPQFLERRYNRAAKVLLGVLFVCQALLIAPLMTYTASIAALGLFGFEVTVTNLLTAALLITAVVGTYSIIGGLTSVVVTDVVQVVIMLTGGIAVTIIGLMKVGGLSGLYAAAGSEMFTLLRPANDPYLPWNAIIPGQLINALFFSCASFSILQRALGARDVRHAQKGLLLGAFLKMSSVAVLALPGIIAAQLYPDASPDATYTMLVRDLLPVGLTGIVMAGLLAAMMSTQDSNVNALSGLVALDLYPVLRPGASEQSAVRVGKIFAAGSMLWGIAAAPMFFVIEQSIFDLVRKFAGFILLPIGVCYVFGRFSKRVNHQGAMATLVAGLVLGLTYIAFTTFPALRDIAPAFIREPHYYQIFPFFFLIFSAILVAVSVCTPPPSEQQLAVLKLAEVPDIERTPEPWYRRYGLWWGVYLALFVGVFVVFT